MQIEYEMEISAQEMFDFVCQQTIEDYYMSTEKIITKEDLHKGFKYKRRVVEMNAFGKKNRSEGTTAIIKEMKEPTVFALNMSSASLKTVLKYEITQDPQEEFFCKVKYTEEIYRNGKKEEEQKRRGFLFLKKSPEKDMLQRMKRVEKYINGERQRKFEEIRIENEENKTEE
ncbi:MAG: DUF3284 domain-containing protein [Firmicutes bacterium]|nr:DUF3284 domain-containing protein [Bacillota bacterium]